MQTIRLKLDAKDQLSIPMPKPRYLATIDAPEKSKRKPLHVEEENMKDLNDWNQLSSSKEIKGDRFELPKINDSRREKVHS